MIIQGKIYDVTVLASTVSIVLDHCFYETWWFVNIKSFN